MRIWYFSDIHLELTRGFDLPSDRPDYDVLVVAGDLVSRMERGVVWLRERIKDRPVIYVPGNHEAYGADVDRTVEKAREAARGTSIHVMQDGMVEIDGVAFVGGTLWTDFALFGDPDRGMAVASEKMNDYKKIRIRNYEYRLRPTHTFARHFATRRFIFDRLAERGSLPTVVVTHHAPWRGALQAEFTADPVSAAYASDIPELIEGRGPDLWIHGHIHAEVDAVVGRTRLLCNPKGYGPWNRHETWENPAFDPRRVVELPAG